ncbi:MAG: TIGR03000 domain-containing protein [Planctomycetia bacterium]|nr:TIGR03000 domain-containing protein [Planctomycetia bacterium]
MIMKWKIVVSSMVLAASVFTCTQASAWWGIHAYGGPRHIIGAGCCDPCLPSPCISTCCDPCIATCDPCFTCSPCFDPCGPCFRPAPIRRILFAPFRWVFGRGCCAGWSDCCVPACIEDPCMTVNDGSEIIYENSDPAVSPTTAPAPATNNKSTVIEPSPVTTIQTHRDGVNIHHASYSSLQNSQNAKNSGLLTIYVPMDAKVYVNGQLTEMKGSRRAFVSFDLQEGYEYDYVIKAIVVRDGQKYEETKTVTLQAGDNQGVTFPFEALNLVPSEEDYVIY